MTSWLSIGIDGGLHGAVVGINDNLEVIDFFDTPIIDLGKKGKGGKVGTNNAFLENEMVGRLRFLLAKAGTHGMNCGTSIILEKAQSMPKQGVVSTFKTGEGFGLWKGILAALGCPYEVIATKVWQKRVMVGVTGLDPKAKSISRCQRLFPGLPLTKPKGKVASLDGRADAALIAYYGLLELGKVQEQKPKRTAFKF
ncbi:hypothetical protein MUP59_06065 [Candidatus Bathyarchaeota archaeon]|nr:hypothetical protein [Candidatus Bathyarchaeota archaeon]